MKAIPRLAEELSGLKSAQSVSVILMVSVDKVELDLHEYDGLSGSRSCVQSTVGMESHASLKLCDLCSVSIMRF